MSAKDSNSSKYHDVTTVVLIVGVVSLCALLLIGKLGMEIVKAIFQK